MELQSLLKLFELKDIDFINLQYGEVQNEISQVQSNQGISIRAIEEVDLYHDIDSAMRLIQACDIVVTTSNSTAHMAGALGKETLLLLPFSAGKFWYWHDLDGLSLWYPSVRVFKQLHQGDWTEPVESAKKYLENKFAI
jgi:ADP-heptose:LPS heptosyltransferase